MSALLRHLIVLPVVVPLLAGTLMFFIAEQRRHARVAIALTSLLTQLSVGVALLYLTSDAAPYIWPDGVGVYPVGGWPAPFGIVLVVDRLAAVMVTLSATIGLSALIYSVTRWDRPGQPFHSLFQFLTMGLNGAFLTGDLFNLFVFFEVLLAASYGLMLRGGGTERVRLGLHYIAVNLTGSILFLVGVALIYGTVCTLNMADLAGRAMALTPEDRASVEEGRIRMQSTLSYRNGVTALRRGDPEVASREFAEVKRSTAPVRLWVLRTALRMAPRLTTGAYRRIKGTH